MTPDEMVLLPIRRGDVLRDSLGDSYLVVAAAPHMLQVIFNEQLSYREPKEFDATVSRNVDAAAVRSVQPKPLTEFANAVLEEIAWERGQLEETAHQLDLLEENQGGLLALRRVEDFFRAAIVSAPAPEGEVKALVEAENAKIASSVAAEPEEPCDLWSDRPGRIYCTVEAHRASGRDCVGIAFLKGGIQPTGDYGSHSSVSAEPVKIPDDVLRLIHRVWCCIAFGQDARPEFRKLFAAIGDHEDCV